MVYVWSDAIFPEQDIKQAPCDDKHCVIRIKKLIHIARLTWYIIKGYDISAYKTTTK